MRNIGKVDVIKSIDLGRKEIFLSFYLSVHLKSQELFLIHPLVQHNSVPAPRQCKSTGLHTKIAYFFCFYIVLNNQKVHSLHIHREIICKITLLSTSPLMWWRPGIWKFRLFLVCLQLCCWPEKVRIENVICYFLGVKCR